MNVSTWWVFANKLRRLSDDGNLSSEDIVMGIIFRKYFAGLGELGSKPTFFLIYQFNAMNQKPIMMSYGFSLF